MQVRPAIGPRAVRELDAVVDGTERAAHQIMDAAEAIARAAKSLTASQTKNDTPTPEFGRMRSASSKRAISRISAGSVSPRS